jgi:hypothetical protein
VIKISLNKQVHIYSVDTSAFYNAEESNIHILLNELYIARQEKTKEKKKIKPINEKDQTSIELITQFESEIQSINHKIDDLKNVLYDLFKKNQYVRELHESALIKRNVVSVFDSTLTRTLGMEINKLSMDIIVVKTFFFDVIEDIIVNGFYYKDEKYICFTASAGQIRTKKTVFIKESLWNQHKESLMCGLSIEKINQMGGVNINKYLAYLALCNSATDEWVDFNIHKSIVVDDMETVVRGLVDFIDEKTYEITRQEMDIPINHTDGCGMILPQVKNKNFMVRLPWIKGLLSPFPFDKFINQFGGGKIKDIYGKEYDIVQDGIQIIFTKSQFKMSGYYSSWDDYKQNFIQHRCCASICNEEESKFARAKINYQMLQTLSDLSEEELKTICQTTITDIKTLGSDKDVMLKVFGVTSSNHKKTYLQQALEIYPSLLSDIYTKNVLKQLKKSLVNQGRSGRVEIDGVYTFIIPDLYAFCEYLFLENKNPVGLLKNQEVYCDLYPDAKKLDCLRSPHLYREHAVRQNTKYSIFGEWFVTHGLYTSCHDLISKILQFDVDGDKALVCADETIIKAAERNMNDIVPLFYHMAKAGKIEISNKIIYSGLKYAYTGGNIGMISNDITKIWNSENINLDAIKLLCMENNFVID